ncbi:MAG: hypothetical protein ACHQ9S_23200 [Candidatus Binatia bacterium]
MPWTATFIAEFGIVETTHAGRLTPEELREAVAATLGLASERKTHRYLGDCTGLEHGASVSDTYALTRFYETLPIDRLSKEAILLPASQDAETDMRFYETLTRNRGFDVRVFRTRQEAISWLVE